jgi:hypothetical protein
LLEQSSTCIMRALDRRVKDVGAILPALKLHPCLPH